MQRIGLLVSALSLGALMLGPTPGVAAPAQTDASAAAATEFSAQARPKRPRTKIVVTPRRYPYRTYHTTYPLPYRTEYPGPGAVRECRARLVQEFRPSGTVIVPRMQCWWTRG